MKLRSHLALHVLAITAVFCTSHAGSSAATITWGTPTTIADDTDVVTTGVLSYAYDLSNTTTTVNGVAFTGANSSTALGGNITLNFPTGTGNNATTFGSASGNPWNGLSANYKNILKGGVYNSGSAATVTLKNLTIGAQYTVQLWVNDNRTSGASRTQLVDGANQMDFNSTELAGGVGQFITGTFTADATNQAITLDGNNTISTQSTQLAAIQVREIPEASWWLGTVDGNWDDTTGNFTGDANWSTLSSAVTSATFADADHSGNPVANPDITIQAAGVSTGTVRVKANSTNYSFVNASGTTGITGATALLKSGTGMLTLHDTNSYTGGTTISAGTLTILKADSLGTTGTINIGGSASYDANLARLRWDSGVTADLSSRLSINSGLTAVFDIQDNDVTFATAPAFPSSNGSIYKEGTGRLTLDTAGFSMGRLDHNDGNLKVVSGNHISNGYFTLNTAGSSATYEQTGGTFTLSGTGGQGLYVGNSTATTPDSTFTLSGGSFTTNGTDGIYFRFNGSATLNVSGAGALSAANTAANNGGLRFTKATGHSATFHLGDGTNFVDGTSILNGGSSGLFTTNRISYASGSGEFLFNGGTLKASMANPAFFNQASGLATKVQAAGGVIDNNSLPITIGEALESDTNSPGGELIFRGAGTTTLRGANTFTGKATAETGSTLNLAGAVATSSFTSGTSVVFNSNVITVTDTSGLVPGQSVTITGGGTIPTGSFITAITSPTTFTLQANATASGSPTLISFGALTAGTWTFAPAATGVSNKLTGSGTLAINGNFHLNLANADITNGNSWTLADATTQSFGSSFAITSTLSVPFTESGDVWTATDGNNTWTFTESTGTLSLTVATGTPFTSWADTHITAINATADATPQGDPDGDGKTNFSEFAFNGDPLSAADNGKMFVLTSDSDADVDTNKELILTVAVRATTPAFSGTPSPTSTGDGVIYTIQGSTTLESFPVQVDVVPTPVTTDLPTLTDPAYVYRSFSLNGSNGLTGQGFLRAHIQTTP